MPGDENTNRSFWTPARILTTIVVFALVATLGYTFLGGGSEVSTSSNVALPGSPASSAPAKVVPPDFEVPTIDGSKLKLSSYRGKVLVVDFWATWCGPCREEVPQLVRLARENKDRGIEVIGLHIDDQGRSSQADIRKFMTQFNVNYTIAQATNEMFTAYLGSVETRIPQTMVFDRKGNAVAHFVGYDQSHARELEEAINHALTGS